jgi:Mrp family chromosome partitioning ATPase
MSDFAELRADPELLRLYRRIDGLLPIANKVIQLIGVDGGDGCRDMARRFAWSVAVQDYRRVLLVDASGINLAPSGTDRLEQSATAKEADVATAGLPMTGVQQYQATSLYLGPVAAGRSRSVFENFLTASKSDFSLIVVDSGVLHDDTDDLFVSRTVDGVLLVIEADSSPMDITEAIAERIKNLNGNLLGAVLSNYRDFVPRPLVRLLDGSRRN